MATGIQGYAQGAIYDQTLLLRDIRDGLAVYNRTESPLLAALSEPTTRETLRVSQGPKSFRQAADGGKGVSERAVYRDLSVPFKSYDLSSEFTVQWLQDALPSDIMGEMDTAIAGYVELVEALFWASVFTKRTVGAIGTAYQAGFYNGELDVPNYKNNAHHGTAHYHYIGINTTTLAKSHIQAMKADIQEHGYGLTPGSLHLFANSAQQDDILGLMDTNASTTILQAITANRERAIDFGLMNTGVLLEGVQVHIDDNVPAGYLGMVASDVKAIARREHFRPEYRGLQTFGEGRNPDYPLEGMNFLRRIGFAVQHMGAGCCRQIVGSTTYTNPTFRSPIE